MNDTLELSTGFIDRKGLRTAVLLLAQHDLELDELKNYWLGKHEHDSVRIANSVALLKEAGIVELSDDKVRLSKAFGNELKQKQVDDVLEGYVLRSVDARIYDILFASGTYNESTAQYSLHHASVPLFLAGLRDLLVNFGLLERLEGTFIISSKLEEHLQKTGILSSAGKKGSVPLSLKEYKGVLLARERNGVVAESLAMEYEAARLAGTVHLPVQVSLTDVGKGYDIESFESADSTEPDRHIEVKSVRRSDISFYLTANELTTARRLGDRYYLYLIDISVGPEPVMIIRDAYTKAYTDASFAKSEQLYKFHCVDEAGKMSKV